MLIRGQGTEFDSLREYVVGDDVRSIDWRATARRSDVVVRTWRPERDRRTGPTRAYQDGHTRDPEADRATLRQVHEALEAGRVEAAVQMA